MLQLTANNIKLGQSQSNKLDAIRSIAADLTEKGLVDAGYVEGMLNREGQNSTFLGNGIAIPHGTTDTRSLVKETGVAVHHFANGVDWGDGNTVYVAIGIAAKSDEHLGILKQLTKVLSADGVEAKLKEAKSANDIIALLNGDVQFEADFDAATILVNFPANDMVQLSAVSGGLLKNFGCVDTDFVSALITATPTNLGNGLWLVSSDKAVKRTGLAFVSAAEAFEINGQAVKGLLTISACNAAHKPLLDKVVDLVSKQAQQTLVNADVAQVLALFATSDDATPTSDADAITATFKIKNAHGLHARPGAMLVAEAKKFDATIKVSNVDGTGKPVNAKSLMKVIALGVKHGHQLQFTAEGTDAAQALEAIGAAIASGLGEA
jgi:multiphosphoryl transfer protein